LDTQIEVTLCETGWWLDRAWPQLVRCALANTPALFPKVRRWKENGRKPEERSEDQLEDQMKSDKVCRSDGPESGVDRGLNGEETARALPMPNLKSKGQKAGEVQKHEI
jgi:hypothetical protein